MPSSVRSVGDTRLAGATWAEGDPVAGLRAAVESVRPLPDVLDALLMSGDLADNAADCEYELVRELLAQLGVPVYVVPRNHDDRDTLRRHFDLPGAMGSPVQYAVDVGPLRLVVLEGIRPGEDRGELDAGHPPAGAADCCRPCASHDDGGAGRAGSTHRAQQDSSRALLEELTSLNW